MLVEIWIDFYENTSMSGRKRGLSGTELAAALGVAAHRRSQWARSGILSRREPPALYGQLDALELGCFAALNDAVGPKRAKRVWPSVRLALRAQLPGKASRLWVVVDRALAEDAVETSAARAIAAASRAPGSVNVLAMHDVAAASLGRFSKAVGMVSQPDEGHASQTHAQDLVEVLYRSSRQSGPP
jgi:hypothetical protein